MNKLKNSPKPHVVTQMRKTALQDMVVAVLVVTALTFGTLIFEIELVEYFYNFTRAHENWDLDEALLFCFWLGLAAIIYSFRRVKDIKKLNSEIIFNAYFDSLTNLPNRSLGLDRLEELIHGAKRNNQRVLVAFLDFDKFKYINDAHGHKAGDQLLVEISERIFKTVRQGETLARLGGDEFLIIAKFDQESDNYHQLIHRIQSTQTEPFKINNQEIKISYSIGVALYPDDADNAENLIQAADRAMYMAKQQGPGHYQLYSEQFNHGYSERYFLFQHLEKAIYQSDLYLDYQAVKTMPQLRVTGYEAFVRWDKTGNQVDPVTLISVAEEYGIISQLTEWIFKTALLEMKDTLEGNQTLSINISEQQFYKTDLPIVIQTVIADTHFKPELLEIEIPEDALSNQPEKSAHQIRQLKRLGVRIVIDDLEFNSTALLQIKNLSIDKVKISKSLIHKITTSKSEFASIQSLFSWAKDQKITIVAKGIEKDIQVRLLEREDCKLMQGYLISKPVPISYLKSYR